MTDPQKNGTIIIIGIFTIMVSIVVMTGWIFNIPVFEQVVPGFVPMAFNMALCFVLFGGALLLTQYQTDKYKNLAFFILSLTGTLIGLITLLQFVFHFNTGLDELFVSDKEKISPIHLYAGRMAFNAAASVSLLGMGLLMLTAKRQVFNLIAQYLFHAVSILSVIALIGYLYGVSLFNSLFYVSSMASHTAILFFILSLAASLLNPSIGITRLFTGRQIGNKMAKRLFSLIIIMLIIFGALTVQTGHYGILTLDIRISLLAVSFLLVSLIIIWDTAKWLNRIDTQRSEAESEIKLMNADLEKIVKERSAEIVKSEEKYRSLIEQASDAIYVHDVGLGFTDVNASMCKMVGYTRDELLQMHVEQIIDPEELKIDPITKRLTEPGQVVFRERRFIRKDRSVFTVEINVKVFAENRVMVMARDISDRKKMETELREAELKFRTIAEKSMVGVYIVQNGKFVYVNPRFAEIFNYKADELINSVPVETIINERYRHITTENVRRRMEGEVESVNYEAMGRKKDGTANWVEFYGNRAMFGDKPTILGSMIDITERKKAEEELRSSEKKYKLLFESSPLPMWMIAKDDMTIIAVNEAAAWLYGYTKDELLNKSVVMLRPQEDKKRQLAGYIRDNDEAGDKGIVTHLKKDGTIMHIQIIANDIFFEGREVRLSFTNDITEKLRAEESLQKSEANLQTILRTTNIVFTMLSKDFEILAFNPKAAEFVKLHYKRNLEKGQRFNDYMSPERAPQVLAYLQKVLKGKTINYEIDYREHWYHVSFAPITGDTSEILGMLITLEEITERKKAEQDLKSAYERIQNHINSIKDMAWKQSHLMRSPLANLKALADMLKYHPADTVAFEHFQTELDRMDAIIHEMAQDASDHDID